MSLKSIIAHYVLEECWNVGFSESTLESVLGTGDLGTITWLKHEYHDRWFADPFILEVSEETILLAVEEFLYSQDRGRIALLTIRRKDYQLLSNQLLIEEPTHLSFPFVLHYADKTYIIPENGASGQLKLYLYDPALQQCRYVKTLIEESLADAVIADVGTENFLFATAYNEICPDQLFQYAQSDGVYCPIKTVNFATRNARNAGAFFSFKGKVYRPAQDCSSRYGGSFEIQEYNKEKDEFNTIWHFSPVDPVYNVGIHTFNHNKGVSVVDGCRYRRPLLAKLYLYLSSLRHLNP